MAYSRYAIILGAGASFGAAVGPPTPPLDGRFLYEAKSCLSGPGKRDSDAEAWSEFRRALEDAGLRVSDALEQRLETLSTYLEARANMPSLQNKAGRPKDYARALNALTQIIARTLAKMNGVGPCALHERLFDFVEPHCVITFNYDLIADQTLLKLGRLAWHRAEYCGQAIYVTSASGGKYRRDRPDRRSRNTTPLLKLHGSINWQSTQSKSNFYLWAGAFPQHSIIYDSVPTAPMVVAPLAAKIDIQTGRLRTLWQKAAKYLDEAPGWIVWGYSFPETDTVTQVLCRTALADYRNPKRIVLINPDSSLEPRIEALLSGKARVVGQWPSVDKFWGCPR